MRDDLAGLARRDQGAFPDLGLWRRTFDRDLDKMPEGREGHLYDPTLAPHPALRSVESLVIRAVREARERDDAGAEFEEVWE